MKIFALSSDVQMQSSYFIPLSFVILRPLFLAG
jgi:hypothetical protein